MAGHSPLGRNSDPERIGRSSTPAMRVNRRATALVDVDVVGSTRCQRTAQSHRRDAVRSALREPREEGEEQRHRRRRECGHEESAPGRATRANAHQTDHGGDDELDGGQLAGHGQQANGLPKALPVQPGGKDGDDDRADQAAEEAGEVCADDDPDEVEGIERNREVHRFCPLFCGYESRTRHNGGIRTSFSSRQAARQARDCVYRRSVTGRILISFQSRA